MSTLPTRPRLVLRAGFAGRQELSTAEQAHLSTALHEVLSTLGHELAGLAPGVPVRTGQEPRVATFFARECPLLRLVTGLCQGADAVAAQTLETVHICPDADASCPPDTRCLETELAAVLPFTVDAYRRSRPADFHAEFDRQLARCAWVLALDGIYDKPDDATLAALPEVERQRTAALAKTRRGRAYRGQSASLLRHSDVLIAAADPDDPGKAGGTLETVREAQVFELPVIFIHTVTGAVHLIDPEEDLYSVLAEPAPAEAAWKEELRKWVNRITADPDHGLNPEDHGHHDARDHGETLLREFFDEPRSPAQSAARWMVRFRKWAWASFEGRFKSGGKLKRDTPLAPYAVYRERATELNRHYSGLYRGAFLLNYAAAITAVILAAVSLALLTTGGHTPLGEDATRAMAAFFHLAEPPAGNHGAASGEVVSTAPAPWLHPVLLALAAMKLGIVIFIARNTRRANEEKWNDRAVDYRYLAERLRAMFYLPQAGSQQPPAAAPPQFASRVVRQSAVDWLFDAVVRASSSADLAFATPGTCGSVPVKKLLTLQPLAVVERVRDAWIAEQAKYHEGNARTMHALHHVFEKIAVFLGWTVIGVVSIDLVIVGCEVLEHLDRLPASIHFATWEHAAKAATPWLIFTSAVLPAVIAALGGIRFQSESQRLAERSAVMHVMLAGRKTHAPGEKLTGGRHAWQLFTGFWKTVWLILRHLAGHAPVPPPIAFVGGRWAEADRLARRIAGQQEHPASDIGSWTHDALRLTERVATDFVQEAAEWSVLYAKEVSDPG